MTSLTLFITHRARPGKRDEVRHIWETHMAPTVAENPGHLAYFYCFANDDLQFAALSLLVLSLALGANTISFGNK